MNFLQLASPSLGLPQTRLRVRRDFNVKALINVGSGYLDLVSGRPCTLTGVVKPRSTVGPSGRRFYAMISSVYAESPTGLANGVPVTLVAVSTSTSGSSVAGLSDTRGSLSSTKIDSTSGVLTATCKVSGGTNLSITGPTVTVGKTYAAALHWRPGVGLRASFNGGDVQSASHSDTTLYVTPATVWMGGEPGSNVYLLAAIAGELSDTDLRALSANPWSLFDAEDHPLWWPTAASAGVEASGALQSISLVAPAGSATGSATASAAFSTASLSSPTGAATGSATTGGSLAPLSLTETVGSATGSATASVSLPAIALSAQTGSAVGACTASGAISWLSIAPPAGTAFSVAGTVADGSLSQITLSAPTGGASGSASASGMLQPLALSTLAASASGKASCAAALPVLSLTPLSSPTGEATGSATTGGSLAPLSLTATVGSATGSATASAAFSTASLSSPTGAATGSATTGGSLAPLSLTATVGSASTGGAVLATGGISPIVLSAPSGYATGASTASCALAEIFLTSPLGNALSGTTPVLARRRTVAGSAFKFARPASLSTRRRECR